MAYLSIHYHISSGNAEFCVRSEDLWDKPLIISRQDDNIGALTTWIKHEISEIEIIATYNLLFNAYLMVEEGMSIIWKKYQVFSKASEKFIQEIKELTKIACYP